ncbi:hypothetical protein PpBr36_07199 [Pyricularia pennisetigena]|uniref:hypothetical protein n=1 Tax=Pyricularia pennisetigena TaxID=1578925 RepID=UPI00114F0848|nr:hypothetical protein PpBr36_07199 [Pyricularia pennisetigena]TLS25386.1 hypothetical protein PpBr36_07199 [Pyricularia pennisetigena]
MLNYSGLIGVLLSMCAFAPHVAANVEKTIFLGPETINVPHQSPTIADLGLDVLSPHSAETRSIRTYLEAEFPGKDDQGLRKGKTTWLLLDNLKPGQRYEVRVCWMATQPTSFTLKTHEVPVVWDTPELISALSEYSTARLEKRSTHEGERPEQSSRKATERQGEHEASVLLLEILAAADYFTDDADLMEKVEPVHVDIILDPYVFNVLPRSLIPTVLYILVVATVFSLFARRMAAGFREFASDKATTEKKKQ